MRRAFLTGMLRNGAVDPASLRHQRLVVFHSVAERGQDRNRSRARARSQAASQECNKRAGRPDVDVVVGRSAFELGDRR